MALEQLRLNVENLNEGMTPSMQKLQAQFQEDVIGTLVQALNSPPWVDVTTAQEKVLWLAANKKPSEFAKLLIAKFKELNE